jgi:3'-phosphoadenosine 5'-phosphosulfate (PAPS) 3'-phosphatase
MDGAGLIDVVGEAMRQVAADVIVPRFRALVDGEVTEKGPGDVVTVADTEAERALTGILAALLPGSVVVGEEAVAARPDLVRLRASSERRPGSSTRRRTVCAPRCSAPVRGSTARCSSGPLLPLRWPSRCGDPRPGRVAAGSGGPPLMQ